MQNLNILYKNLEEKYEVMLKINKINIDFEENLKHTEIFKVESLDDFLNKKEKLIDDLELLEAKTSSYFEKIKDCRKKLEMTDKCKKSQNKISNIFPVKYNQKKKYITFFTDNDE